MDTEVSVDKICEYCGRHFVTKDGKQTSDWNIDLHIKACKHVKEGEAKVRRKRKGVLMNWFKPDKKS